MPKSLLPRFTSLSTSVSNITPFLLVIMISVFGNCGAFAKESIPPTSTNAPTQAPRFMLPSISGEQISLRDFAGDKLRQPFKNKKKYHVILSFWATYCIPCKKEIPELEKLVAKYSDDVVLLLVSIDNEGLDKVTPYVNNAKFTSPVLIDKYQVAAKKYSVEAVPSTFLVDKDGFLQGQTRGYDENTLKILSKLLQKLVTKEKSTSK